MTTTIYGIKACDTMKKARTWLEDHGIEAVFHDYKAGGIGRAQLEAWCEACGYEAVLNKAGTTFRKLDDESKANLDRDKAVALMLAQPSMIKRPVLVTDGKVTIGFKPDQYAALFSR